MSDLCKFTGKPYNCGNCAGAKTDWTGKGEHSVCIVQSVFGPLMRNTKRDWTRLTTYCKRSDGGRFSAEELKQEFMRMHSKGWNVIPISDCDNHCYKNGCQGHAKKARQE